MNLVTVGDRTKALQLVGGGSPAQDRLLLSLAQQTTWTRNQRALVERMLSERTHQRDQTHRATAG